MEKIRFDLLININSLSVHFFTATFFLATTCELEPFLLVKDPDDFCVFGFFSFSFGDSPTWASPASPSFFAFLALLAFLSSLLPCAFCSLDLSILYVFILSSLKYLRIPILLLNTSSSESNSSTPGTLVKHALENVYFSVAIFSNVTLSTLSIFLCLSCTLFLSMLYSNTTLC